MTAQTGRGSVQDVTDISWRDPEIILLLAGVVLTLILLGVFIYVFTRKQE